MACIDGASGQEVAFTNQRLQVANKHLRDYLRPMPPHRSKTCFMSLTLPPPCGVEFRPDTSLAM